MVDLALIAEEFYAVDANVSLTLFASLLGLLPVLNAGSPDQVQQTLRPFLSGTAPRSPPSATASRAGSPTSTNLCRLKGPAPPRYSTAISG